MSSNLVFKVTYVFKLFLFKGFIVSHSSDRSGSLFIIFKGYCIAVDDNGIESSYGPGAVIGLTGLWFSRTIKTVIRLVPSDMG